MIVMKRRELLTSALGVALASTFPSNNGFAADVPAVGSHGDKVVLSDGVITSFRKNIRGSVIVPSSPDYEAARHIWNGSFDRHPAMVVRCADPNDVVSAVQFARSNNLLVAVRCGGHSYSGQSTCDGGIVIDLSPMHNVTVDQAAKIAHVDGGSLLGNLDRAAEQYGLATTAGFVSHTGIGGLATGGGQGRLQRKFGLTVDNILGVDIVTADGKLLHANKDENSDLWWAVRGGGGNFGIVTNFHLQLHLLDPTVTTFSYTYPIENAIDVAKFYFDFSRNASDNLAANVGLRTPLEGPMTVSLSGTFIGSPKEAEAELAPIAKFSKKPIKTVVTPARYVELQAAADRAYAPGREYYSRSGFFNRVDPKLAETVVDVYTRTPTPRTSISVGSQGGYSGRVPENATAYAHRDALYQVSVSADWDDHAQGPALMKFCRETWGAVAPMSDGGFYINQTTDEGEKAIRENYRGNYDRLVEVKTKYDPSNLFHLNANIRPRPV